MNEPREQWESRLGFVLAAAGAAIGLGTMWRLPYVMGQNGGGAFILLFLCFNFLIGVPLFIGELMLGRQTQRGPVGCFAHFTSAESSWTFVGWLSVIASMLILGWYAVVAGWGLNYILMALTDAFKGLTPEQSGEAFVALRQSGGLNVFWQLLFLFANVTIVLGGLSKGIEHWSKIMTTGLFAVLIVLVIYASTLSGFSQAVHYVLYPDFSGLTANSVFKALGLALFTLSLGYGVMVSYGSYMKKTEDIPKTALIVCSANFVVSVLIALMIFPMVFTFGIAPQEGEGLIFKTLPYVFEQLPGSIVLSVLFFTLLIFAALTSSLGMLEAAVANFIDLYGWSRKKAVWISFGICFVLGLPTALSETGLIFPHWQEIFGVSFFDTNDILDDWLLAFVAFFTSVFIGHRLNKKELKDAFGSGSTLGSLFGVWLLLIRYVVPSAILLVILNRAGLLNLGALTEYSIFPS